VTTAAPPVVPVESIEQSARSLRLTRVRQVRLVLLAAPLILFLVVAYGYPLVEFLARGVLDPALTSSHIHDFLTDGVGIKITLLTFRLAATVTIGTLLLGYPVAYLLSTLPARTSNLLMILVLIPFWTSILVRTYAWMVILGHDGVINNFLAEIHVIKAPLPLLFNEFSVHVGMIHILLPYMILTIYSVMRGIDRSLLRAAQSLGATPWTAFRKIFLPLSLPGVFAGCVLVFILSLGFYITPELLGGPSDYTVSMFMSIEINELLDWGYAAVLAGVLLIATVLVFLLSSRFVAIERVYRGRT
jgi:putative spermidine/putrescine transport system permease protein